MQCTDGVRQVQGSFGTPRCRQYHKISAANAILHFLLQWRFLSTDCSVADRNSDLTVCWNVDGPKLIFLKQVILSDHIHNIFGETVPDNQYSTPGVAVRKRKLEIIESGCNISPLVLGI